MHPVLFTIDPPFGPLVEISTYRTAYTLAALLALLIAWGSCVRFGMDPRRSFAVVLASAVALPLGARLWHIVTNPGVYAQEPARAWTLQPTGHALFGGVALMALIGLVAARFARLDAWRIADAAAPALAIGVAVMRVGCFSSGCCFGIPTRGVTGVVFPPGSPAHFWQIGHDVIGVFEAPVAIHPTQLYELGGAIVCGALAVAVMRAAAPAGVAFLTFIGTFAVVRWTNWGVRAHPDTLSLPEWAYPLIYGGTVLFCAALLASRLARAISGTGIPRPRTPMSRSDPADHVLDSQS